MFSCHLCTVAPLENECIKAVADISQLHSLPGILVFKTVINLEICQKIKIRIKKKNLFSLWVAMGRIYKSNK